jgi:hypothetical protein
LKGKFKGSKSYDVFADFVRALVMKRDKEERGVGKQGFVYAPNITEFAQIVQMESPKAYETISELLPLPTRRALQ